MESKLNVFAANLECDTLHTGEDQTEWSCWINAGWSQF